MEKKRRRKRRKEVDRAGKEEVEKERRKGD